MRRRQFFERVGIVLLALSLTSPMVAAGGGQTAQADAVTENIASEIASEADLLGAFGAYWDSAAGELALVFPSNAATISAVQFAGRGVGVRIERSAVSDADFLQAKKQVAALVSDGTLRGKSTEVAINLQSGKLEITSTAEQAIFSGPLGRLGDAAVFRPAKGEFQRLDRINDAPPYWGGGEVKTSYGHCTSGFSVYKSGKAWMLTAGHCFTANDFVTDGHGDPYGQVLYQIFPLRDIELIGNNQYGGWIWLGILNHPPQWGNVIGASNPAGNFTYCSSGRYSQEKCGIPATAVNVYNCDPEGFCTDKMVRFSGENWWQPGDSGGPIFTKYTTNPLTVHARATIIGNWNGNSYGQQWSGIVDGLGVTICTKSNGPC